MGVGNFAAVGGDRGARWRCLVPWHILNGGKFLQNLPTQLAVSRH